MVLTLTEQQRPRFRSKCTTNGHVSDWDHEWFHHFADGGFADIEWIELSNMPTTSDQFWAELLTIGFCGEHVDTMVRLFGFVPKGAVAKHLAARP